MLMAYLDAAMHRAIYEQLDDDEGWFVAIHELPRLSTSREPKISTRQQLHRLLNRGN